MKRSPRSDRKNTGDCSSEPHMPPRRTEDAPFLWELLLNTHEHLPSCLLGSFSQAFVLTMKKEIVAVLFVALLCIRAAAAVDDPEEQTTPKCIGGQVR